MGTYQVRFKGDAETVLLEADWKVDAAERFIEREEQIACEYPSLDGARLMEVRQDDAEDDWETYQVIGMQSVTYSAVRLIEKV